MAEERKKRLYHDFSILDHVFQDFVDSNSVNGRHRHFDEILDLDLRIPHEFSFDLGERYLYRANVFKTIGPTGEWIEIGLVNHNFSYEKKYDSTLISRRGHDAWIELEEAWSSFENMQSTLRQCGYDRNTAVTLFYNSAIQSVDIIIQPDKRLTTLPLPNLRITFEPGYPEMDDDKHRWYRRLYDWK